jgi:hypothetical protein
MSEGELLARLRQAEDRLRQLEYRLRIVEDENSRNAQIIASLRSASAN